MKQIDSIEQKMLRALESEENEEYSTEQILSDLYETSKSHPGKPTYPLQVSHGLDHNTLHPFVHLTSVFQKPPISEYTSITDSIDTSKIDRPPSPQMILPWNSRTPLSDDRASSKTCKKVQELDSNLSNLDDFTRGQSHRNRVARQESEMLRLAEESQHVILSQLANKIIKTGSVDGSQVDDGLLLDVGEDKQEVREMNMFAKAFNSASIKKAVPTTINEEVNTFGFNLVACAGGPFHENFVYQPFLRITFLKENFKVMVMGNGVRHAEKINSYTKNSTKKSLVRHIK